ncbi:MAG: DUF4173 domain-containing protein, partial [Oscillospiraceae bacterium]|nr:DUF4173 domain-containing protein [Oscillospiraceae bacterium]
YAFTLVFTVTADSLMKTLAMLFLFASNGLLLFHTANPFGDILRFLPVSLGKGVLSAPFVNYTAGMGALSSGAKTKGFWQTAGYVLLGLVIAVPVTAIAGSLLCQADSGMQSMIARLFQIPMDSITPLLMHLVIGFLIGLALFGMLYASVHRSLPMDADECAKMTESFHIIPSPVVYAAVTPLCLLYVLFFFTQMQYFFGGYTGDAAGFTYAEYARKGFFELCWVCCLNFAVIAGMGFLAKRSDGRKPLPLKIYGTFLCICSLLLTDTALSKMFLYIRVYGMTQLRVYTSWFMLLLAVLFILLLVRQFREHLNFGKLAAIAFTVLTALLCFSRPDAWITRYNAEMYLAGQLEHFDDSVLRSMSDDAWAALTAYDADTLHKLLHADAEKGLQDRTDSQSRDLWESSNLSAWELLLYRG